MKKMRILNNYLYLFILDEIKNNYYYCEIREYIKVNNYSFEDVAETITKYYCYKIDYFGPYKFIDAIENFLETILENEEYELYNKPIEDIIIKAFCRDAFDFY